MPECWRKRSGEVHSSCRTGGNGLNALDDVGSSPQDVHPLPSGSTTVIRTDALRTHQSPKQSHMQRRLMQPSSRWAVDRVFQSILTQASKLLPIGVSAVFILIGTVKLPFSEMI